MKKPPQGNEMAAALAAILEGRLKSTFEQFCADIPQLLGRLQTGTLASEARDGSEFVRVLLEWIAQGSRRSDQASRYLLMWYAKTLAGKRAYDAPDCRAVAVLIRERLTPPELEAVDQALAEGWASLDKGGSLMTLASKRRKDFLAWLTPEQKRRYQPFLGAFIPLIVLPGTGAGPPTEHAQPASGSALGGARSAVSRDVIAAAAAAALVLGAGAWLYAGGDDDDARAQQVVGYEPHAEQAERAVGVGPSAGRSDKEGAKQASRPAVKVAGPFKTWTRRDAGTKHQLDGVAWSGARVVAVGYQGTIVTSEDGVTWRVVERPATASEDYTAITHGNGLFVALGTTGRGTNYGRVISTSADGLTWMTQNWKGLANLNGAAHGNGAWIAVGNRGSMVRSVDGETWDEVKSGTDNHLDGVSFIDGQFVVVGHRGTIMTSPDGLTWKLTKLATDNQHHRAISANGTTFAFGGGPDGGAVWRSSDLASWTEESLAGTTYLRNVAFAKGTFVATGPAGVLTSLDGREWTTAVPSTWIQAVDVAWTGARMVVVGNNGSIYSSKPSPSP